MVLYSSIHHYSTTSTMFGQAYTSGWTWWKWLNKVEAVKNTADSRSSWKKVEAAKNMVEAAENTAQPCGAASAVFSAAAAAFSAASAVF